MTLVIAALGRESIWIAADRRLTTSNGRVDCDDAVKVLSIERGNDGALVSYAGLGRTPRGTQPSDWMNAVLRGASAPLVDSLHILARAMERQFPKYLLRVGGPDAFAHVVLAPAFVEGKPFIYSIRLDLDRPHRKGRAQVARHVAGPTIRYNPRIGLAGSGAPKLMHQTSKLKHLLRLISKHEQRKIGTTPVARELAQLVYTVSQQERTVGAGAIVAWQYRRNGPFVGGGAYSVFDKGNLVPNGLCNFPMNWHGRDINNILNRLIPLTTAHVTRIREGRQGLLNQNAVDEALRGLPTDPDETL